MDGHYMSSALISKNPLKAHKAPWGRSRMRTTISSKVAVCWLAGIFYNFPPYSIIP